MAGGADPDGRAAQPAGAAAGARRSSGWSTARARGVIALSPGIRDGVIAAGVPAERIVAGAERLRPRAVLALDRARARAARPRRALRVQLLRHAWARPTTSPRWSRRRALLRRHDLRAAWATASGARELERERGAAATWFPGAGARQGGRGRAGRGVGRLPDDLQGRAGARHQLAEQAVRHVRRGPPGDREHGRLDARAGGGQRGRAVRARPATPATWPRSWPGCATTRRRSRAMGRNARALAEREFDRDLLAGARARRARGGGALTALSYCVVNTNGREQLLACLDAIERTHPPGVEHEVLVLDNASDDGSAEAVRERYPDGAADRARAPRRARPRTTRACCARRAARYCLLLNEDSELEPGARAALLDALEADPRAAAAGRAAARPATARPTACAWRLPDAGWALAARRCSSTARYAVQSRGGTRARGRLGAVERDAGAARGRGAGGLARPRLLRLLGRDRLLPAAARRRLADPVRARRARAVHHDQLSTDAGRHATPDRRVPPRPRPLLPQAPHARHAARSGASAGPGPTWCARPPRWSLPGPRPAPLPAARPPAAAARPRRGAARGGRGVQPPARRSRRPAAA